MAATTATQMPATDKTVIIHVEVVPHTPYESKKWIDAAAAEVQRKGGKILMWDPYWDGFFFSYEGDVCPLTEDNLELKGKVHWRDARTNVWIGGNGEERTGKRGLLDVPSDDSDDEGDKAGK